MLVSLLTTDGRVYSASGDLVLAGPRFADGDAHYLVENISRPRRLPRSPDVIAIRHVRTNRFVTRHSGEQLRLSPSQTDTLVDSDGRRGDVTFIVREVDTGRSDGMLAWRLEGGWGVFQFLVWDLSLGCRLIDSRGEGIRRSGFGIEQTEQAADILRFHPQRVSDIREIGDQSIVWLSVAGRALYVDDTGALSLRDLGEGLFLGGELFTIERVDGPGHLRDMDGFRIRRAGYGPLAGRYVRLDGGGLRLDAGSSPDDDDVIFRYSLTTPLWTFWDATLPDHAAALVLPDGYDELRIEGLVFVVPRPDTVPVKQFFSAPRADTLTTATVKGQEEALASGYAFRALLGWAYAAPKRGTVAARQYYHSDRLDHMLVGSRRSERSVDSYTLLYDDCFLPAWSLPSSLEVFLRVFGSSLSDGLVRAFGSALAENRLRGELEDAARNAAIDSEGLSLKDDATARQVRPVGSAGPSVPFEERLRRDVVRALRDAAIVPEGSKLDAREARQLRDSPREILRRLRPARAVRRALVLSGGGAKGAFEVGALETLWAQGYRPDIVCGVSVGAINAVKAAEGTDTCIRELRDLWSRLTSDDQGVFHSELYLKLLELAASAVGGAVADAGLIAIISRYVFGFGAIPMLGDAASLATALSATQATGLSLQAQRLINLATMVHSIHSMAPLRRAIGESINPGEIARSGIDLRLGITDIEDGRYFSVTEPFRDGEWEGFGLVDPEPDMSGRPSWLTQRVFGSDHYAIALADAVYASAAMPIFMEPFVAHLDQAELHDLDIGRVAKLPLGLPGHTQELLDAALNEHGRIPKSRTPIDFTTVAAAIDVFSREQGLPADGTARLAALRRRARYATDGQRGAGSLERYFFDGGLVDAIPIRTALRLGATEITVIGVDELDAGGYGIRTTSPTTNYRWLQAVTGDFLGGVDASSLPMLQHLFATLAGLVLGTTRGDMLSSLGVIDVDRVRSVASRSLDADQRERFVAGVRAALSSSERRRFERLGASTSVGGETHDAYYGAANGDVAVNLILPDRQLLGSLAFNDQDGLEDAIALGREAARRPIAI